MVSDLPYINPPVVHEDPDERFDYTDDERVRDLVEGDISKGLEGAGREHLALALVGVCARMNAALDDYERAETERVLREWGI